MRSLRKLRYLFSSLLTRGKVEKDLDREIEVHVEQLARQYMTDGMGERDAWLQARREFGPVEVLKDEGRDARRVGWIHDSIQDLRYSVRSLLRSPAFSATAILTIGLGIGVNVGELSARLRRGRLFLERA
jgi:hypothetical protein